MVESSLEELSLANNSLTNVPPFGNMCRLTSLNLFGNELKEIPGGAFDGLSQLRFHRVERNEICSLSTWVLIEVNENQLSTE
ncbi:unnamed protein product [Heligmosomoides polygyrus]|uniref:Uncharacterized protein n=1 Tax=Heligmosomoides polygyrus TaxID=6339 RepID=A0A183FAK0_HELPZ|nr:unnamed protein product [Heligmosomoides polygyrus]